MGILIVLLGRRLCGCALWCSGSKPETAQMSCVQQRACVEEQQVHGTAEDVDGMALGVSAPQCLGLAYLLHPIVVDGQQYCCIRAAWFAVHLL